MTNELLEAIDSGDVDKIQSSVDVILNTKIQEQVEIKKETIAKELFSGDK